METVMARAWKHLVSFIALVVLLLSAKADDQQKPLLKQPVAVVDPQRVFLQKQGYVAVPLLQDEKGGCFTVGCKSGAKTFRFGLDTGAENSSLDISLVKKLGLKQRNDIRTAGIDGIQKGVEVTIRELSIGDFDSRATVNTLVLNAFDYTALNADRDQRKLPRCDGNIGHSALWYSAAVIDYSTRTLYLRTPLDNLWPKIEGQWVAVNGQENGRKRQIDPKTAPRLEFKNRCFHLTDGANTYTFGLHVKPEKDHYALVFFDQANEFAKQLEYKTGGLLKVSGNQLSICIALDPAKGMPDDFKAPADSGRLFLEFRREKVVDRPAATADPLRTMLEKKGYVALPLKQEDEHGNCFIVEGKSGTETFPLLLDTGAEFSALDMSLVKKLGLKPKREITGVGTKGTLDGVEVVLRGLSIGSFDSRTTTDLFAVAAFDFTAMNTARTEHRKLRPIKGLLGHSTLEFYSAVIDYSTRTLYLRSPLSGLWPEIEGRWIATSGQKDGREVQLDPKTPARVEFKDRQIHLSDGKVSHKFGLHAKAKKDRYTLYFFDPEQELAEELNYQAGALLKVSGDKLTLCLCTDPEKAKGKLPEEFKAPADSGYVLMEFRREK